MAYPLRSLPSFFFNYAFLETKNDTFLQIKKNEFLQTKNDAFLQIKTTIKREGFKGISHRLRHIRRFPLIHHKIITTFNTL